MKQTLRFGIVFLLTLTLIISVSAESPTAPPGSYYTSWIGNTFLDTKPFHKNVTELISGICISPTNGHVFSSGYAEGGGGATQYNASDGDMTGKYDNIGTGFGDPTSCVTADDNYVYWGAGGKGINRASHNGKNNYTNYFGSMNIQGLFYKAGKIYVSDYGQGKIRVINAATMTEDLNWNCDKPLDLTVDKNGKVWVVIFDPSSLSGPDVSPMFWGYKIKSFSSTGTPGAEITDFEKPIAVAVDNSGLLLVGGLSANCQIWKYDVTSTPNKVGTFGADGGIFAGTPGAFTNTAKLHWIKSIAVDASDNIYTACCYGTFWGGCVEKWNSSGSLLWRDFAGTSLDCAGIDPENETEVYGKYHHYSLDYSKTTPGTEWSLKGFTVDRFKYPTDIRVDHHSDVVSRSLGAGAFRIGGKLFIARSHQEGYQCELFRQETATDGEVLVPSFTMGIAGRYVPNTNDTVLNLFYNNRFYNAKTGEWIEKPKKGDNNGFFCIANNGDLLTVTDDDNKIVQYHFGGLDANSNPIWDEANTTVSSVPEFTYDVRKIYYDSDADVMYVTGDEPEGKWGNFGKIRRYNNWSKGNRTSTWTVSNLPFNDPDYAGSSNYGGGTPTTFAAAGDYLFIGYGVGHIRILKKLDGSLVGTLVQNVNGMTGGDGQVDAAYGLTAYKRLNGEYILLFENASWSNIMMQRWCPGTCTNCDKVAVTGFNIAQDSITLLGKEQKSLTTTITPDSACRNITWKSDNSNIAYVESGRVTGVAVGKTIIRSSIEKGAFIDSTVVIVKNIPVDSIVLSKDSIKISQFRKDTLHVTVYPLNALNSHYTLVSRNSLIAEIDSNGVIKAKGVGSTYLVAKTQADNKTDSCFILVTEVKREPFFGTPMNIPGKIEAENFDYGAEGLSYHDTDPTNNSHQYRLDEGVDIDPCGDTGGGFNIGWVNQDEWLLYYVNVAAGSYDITLRTAALDPDNKCTLLLDDVSLGEFTIPQTGDWQKYANVSKFNVALTAGNFRSLKVYMTTGGFNINYLTFEKSVPIESFNFEKDSILLKGKDTITPKLIILPLNTNRTGVIWKSSNTSLFTVSDQGKITANNVAGGAYLLANSADGLFKDSCFVKISIGQGVRETNQKPVISVFPNPFDNHLNLTEQADEIAVYGMYGTLLRTEKLTNYINTADLASGLYLVHIKKDGHTTIIKCIKK